MKGAQEESLRQFWEESTDQCNTVSVIPGFTVKETPAEREMLLILVFALIIIVPLLISTSVLISGTEPQLQLPGFSYALVTAPVRVSVNFNW